MAISKNPVMAFDYAKVFIKSMPLETVSLDIINRVASYIWMYAPWRWTVASTPSITLVSNTQDYTMAYPSTWLYALTSRITTGDKVDRALVIVPSLETSVGTVGQPSQIAFLGNAGDAAGTVRVSPRPGAISGTQTIVGLYKKQMTLFTNETIQTGLLPFDDLWFWVFEEGVLWQAYLYADDQRAGSASINPKNGQAQFSGQRGNFEAALEIMRAREPLPVTNPLDVDQKDWNK